MALALVNEEYIRGWNDADAGLPPSSRDISYVAGYHDRLMSRAEPEPQPEPEPEPGPQPQPWPEQPPMWAVPTGQPVEESRVGPAGELLVNGQAHLLISLDKFAGWAGAGWLRDEADYRARLGEAAEAGFNCLWSREPVQYAWEQHRMHSMSSAYGLGPRGDVWDPQRIQVMGQYAWMIGWHLSGEFHGLSSDYSAWEARRRELLSLDSRHVTGDLVMILAGYPAGRTPYEIMDYPMPEFTLSEFSPSDQIDRLQREADIADGEAQAGRRFVRAASLTIVSEFATYINGGMPHIPSTEEIYRAFLLLVARNYKAFDVLWGANQVIYGSTAERDQLLSNLEQLRPAIDRAWRDTLGAVRCLSTALRGVILDPRPFQPFTYMLGAYSAQKVTNAGAYVVVVNLTDQPIPGPYREPTWELVTWTHDAGIPVPGRAARVFWKPPSGEAR